jgi:hypothetical protein
MQFVLTGPAVVGLNATDGNDTISTFRNSVCHQKLELSNLVSA